MTIKNQNFELRAGDKKYIEVHINDVDNGNRPLNLNGFTVSWGLYDNITRNPILTKGEDDQDVEIVNAAQGICRIKLTSEDTKDLDEGYYAHEVRITKDDGEPITVTAGFISVKKLMDY